jgi:hypothetical protein
VANSKKTSKSGGQQKSIERLTEAEKYKAVVDHIAKMVVNVTLSEFEEEKINKIHLNKSTMEKESEKMIVALDQTLDNIEFILEESTIAMELAQRHEQSNVQQFCFCMLHRLNTAIQGIKPAFGKYVGDHRRYDFTIGITLRAILLDYIIVLNAVEICAQNEHSPAVAKEKLEEFALIALSDAARHTLQYFKTNLQYIPKESLVEMYSSLVKSNPNCFKPYANDGSEPQLINSTPLKTSDLIHRIRNSSHINRKFSKINAYTYYSKYDHFGQMYYHLSKRQLPEEFENMADALAHLPAAVACSVAILCVYHPTDKELEKQAFRVSRYVEKLETTVNKL